MSGALIDNLVYESEEMKFYLQEKLILETTQIIATLMEEKGIKKSELAEKLGRTKGYITQLLDGRANMTLRTISDVMWALDSSLIVNAGPLGFETASKSTMEYTEQSCSWSQNIKEFSNKKKWEVPPCKSLKMTG
jgi:transcriptional regulator with XRE-family HTH domain